jgi:transposase
MQTVTTIGLDIAKSVFQVHGVHAAGQVVIRRRSKRRYVLAFFQKLPPCLVGIEACASSHYWARELQALGHTVRDAVGLCEALCQAAEPSTHGTTRIRANTAACPQLARADISPKGRILV